MSMSGSGKKTFRLRAYDGWTGFASSIIGLVAPGRAATFYRKRSMLLAHKAASRKGADRNWRGDNRSMDAILLKEWRDITARAREMVQNNSYIAGAIEKICNNVVFGGIKPQVQLKQADGTYDRKRNDAVEAHWKKWAEDPRIDFYEKQELAVRHLWQDGELLVHTFVDPDMLREGLVPLRIELIECDHFNTSIHGQLPNGNYARRGIEFNPKGDPVAYHLYTDHPGNTGSTILYETKRVPADQIIHVFKRKRISQTRGVSWLVSIIMRMRGLEEYEDSERIAARLTSSFAFFIESPFPEYGPEAMGGTFPGYEDFQTTAPTSDAVLPESGFIESGRMQKIPPGAKVNSQGFARPGGEVVPFIASNLRGGSAGMQMSFEGFSNDYSSATYSSARSGSLEERRGYKVQQKFLNKKFNAQIWTVWCRLLLLSNLEPSAPLDIPAEWQAPGWPWVDPWKDAQAAAKELELGLNSRSNLCAERGRNFEDVLAQQVREREMLEESKMLPEGTNAQ